MRAELLGIDRALDGLLEGLDVELPEAVTEILATTRIPELVAKLKGTSVEDIRQLLAAEEAGANRPAFVATLKARL